MGNSVLGELTVGLFADTQEEICCRVVWRWPWVEVTRMEWEKGWI